MGLSLFDRFRRNHAIEHATMHLLARYSRPLRLVARSDWDGYSIYGHIDTETLARATHEGLRALQAGHAELAVHPRCGTGLAAHVLLAGATYGLVSAAHKNKAKGAAPLLAPIMIAVVAAFGQPLSRAAQAHLFTSSSLQGARIVAVHRYTRGGVPVHRVSISHG